MPQRNRNEACVNDIFLRKSAGSKSFKKRFCWGNTKFIEYSKSL